MIKTVLFDVDGTLIDSSEGITKSAQYALDAYDIQNVPYEKLLRFIGPPLVDTFQQDYGFSKEKAVEATAKYRERYNTIGLLECKPYPDMESALRELKAAGYFLAVCSSKPEQTCTRILENLGIAGLFDNICGATPDGRISKKKDVILEFFRRYPDFKREESVLVGDTLFDIEGAVSLGLKGIGVSFGFGNLKEMEEAGASAICDSYPEIVKAIRML